MSRSRRQFLSQTAGLGLVIVCGKTAVSAAESGEDLEESPVPAGEDLMREHGVLNRILLIYEAALARLPQAGEDVAEVVHEAGTIVRSFVEDYHAKLEENYIFPVLEKHQRLTDVVAVLREQHDVGRKVTDRILKVTEAPAWRQSENRRSFARACRAFIRMYRPHESREDTEVFPALHHILSAKELAELGERFEEEEERLFGSGGFEKVVARVGKLEARVGINDLRQFTAQLD